ncbi:MAG: trypsin-like peptidase domain-containing protein, partial [Candidatus Brocadiia bacterium]
FRGRYIIPEQNLAGMGSGFFLSDDGYIVTNYHVVGQATKISVKLSDDRELEATIVGSAENLDISIIKVEGQGFPFLKLGDSDKIRVGDTVYAIGAPFGLRHTVTQGIISAKDRVNVNATQVEDFIQTDAAVNSGNSGGPLLNLDAEVIGVNSAITSRSGGFDGISFAIPSSIVRFVYEKVRKGEKIEGGFIGVEFDDVSQKDAEAAGLPAPAGCYVKSIVPKSPAETAGLREGDIITAVDGRKVRDSLSFRNMIYFHAPGDSVKLDIRRGGKDTTVDVTIGKRSEEVVTASGANRKVLGVTVGKNTRGDEGRVVVLDVEEGSKGASIGLQRGDIIIAINGEKVTDVDSFVDLFGKGMKDGGIRIRIIRNGMTLQLSPPNQGGDNGNML